MNVAALARSKRIWYFFIKMCEICRISGEETNLQKFIADFARSHNLAFQTDAVGNIMVTREKNPQCSSTKTTLLQAHMDMVPRIADGFDFDFKSMPLPLQIDGDMLSCSNKTTLGADNGIGVAAALAVLEDEKSPFGRIKALFTVGEEVGMIGASALNPEWIKDCDQMLNFDSGGGLTVGCAGGVKIHTQLPVYCENYPDGFRGVKVRVSDLAGGHSGCDIHLNRINAIRVLLQLLGAVRCGIISIAGGTVDNAIPDSCEAIVAVDENEFEHIKKTWANIIGEYAAAASPEDKSIKLTVTPCVCALHGLTLEYSRKLANDLFALPDGMQSYDQAFEIASSSCNNAVISYAPDDTVINYSISLRSPDNAIKEKLRRDLVARLEQVGGCGLMRIEFIGLYPGWIPNAELPLVRLARRCWQDLFHEDIPIRATHGGLECGILSAANPGMEVVAFGPDIYDFHTVNERVSISSVDKMMRYVDALLLELGK